MVVNIGLLGFGTVGQGLAHILNNKSEATPLKDINIKKILVRNLEKERKVKVSKDKLTLNPQEIMEDKEIDIIVEVTGDVDLSYRLVKEALNNKKHVVTANKALVSKHFEELSLLAEENDVYFLYEASVAGGIPILKPLKDQIRVNNISRLRGILNGTCNYILTKMTDEGLDYGQALREAQGLGYAEADPSSDVKGLDTLRKLRILSTLAFGSAIREEDIICHGIDKLLALDIKLLKEREMVIKLIGEAVEVDGGYQAIVQPKAFKDGSYFTMIREAYNTVSIEGDFSGVLNFYGPGAGMYPTANAVLTDIIDCVMNIQDKKNPLGNRKLKNKNEDIRGKYYIRISNWKDYEVDLGGVIEEKVFEDDKDFAIITKEVRLSDILNILEGVENLALVNLED